MPPDYKPGCVALDEALGVSICSSGAELGRLFLAATKPVAVSGTSLSSFFPALSG